MTASTTSTTSLAVSLPEPFDFELSTERNRAFGLDLANLWHEGGIHRVLGGREVRVTAAEGGVAIHELQRNRTAERCRPTPLPGDL